MTEARDIGRGLYARVCRYNGVPGWMIELKKEHEDDESGPLAGDVCRWPNQKRYKFEPNGTDDVRLTANQLIVIARFVREANAS